MSQHGNARPSDHEAGRELVRASGFAHRATGRILEIASELDATRRRQRWFGEIGFTGIDLRQGSQIGIWSLLLHFMEHPMSKNEFYYLLLVCMAFGGLAVSLAAASLRYRSWLRQGSRVKTGK